MLSFLLKLIPFDRRGIHKENRAGCSWKIVIITMQLSLPIYLLRPPMRLLRLLTGTKDEIRADPAEPEAVNTDAWEAKIETMMNITSVRRMIYVGMKKGSLMIFRKEQPI